MIFIIHAIDTRTRVRYSRVKSKGNVSGCDRKLDVRDRSGGKKKSNDRPWIFKWVRRGVSASLPRKHVGIVASDPHIADLYTGGGTSVPKREIRIAVTIARADAGYFHESKRSYNGASVTRTTIRFVCQRPTCVYGRTYARPYLFFIETYRRDATRRATPHDATRHDAARRAPVSNLTPPKRLPSNFFIFQRFPLDPSARSAR